jgi:transcriptional regulator with XRE-family HTH domain
MENNNIDSASIDWLLAQRLKALRTERGWSLDELARRSTVSRATLSRLENAEVSPTTSVLGKLCAVYGLPMSRLLRMVEENFVPLILHSEQPVWMDQTTGFRRRSVSPPAQTLAGEVLECKLEPGTHIAYDHSSRPGLEHHLLMIEGQLEINIEEKTYELRPGDCLRYQISGPSSFTTPADYAARYLLFIV